MSELITMAKTVWGEARGESVKGQIAVAWVIKNRADNPRWWGKTIEEVCLKKYQFSCWLESDPNKAKMDKLTEEDLKDQIEICQSVLDEKVSDPTDGANHYHTTGILPSWIRNDDDSFKQPIATIGNHLFYRF
jgi:N-acetylmuramoyl-L-alanine amidase